MAVSPSQIHREGGDPLPTCWHLAITSRQGVRIRFRRHVRVHAHTPYADWTEPWTTVKEKKKRSSSPPDVIHTFELKVTKRHIEGKTTSTIPCRQRNCIVGGILIDLIEYHRFIWLDNGTTSKVSQCSLDRMSKSLRILCPQDPGIKGLQLGALKVTYCVFSDGIVQILAVSSAYWSYRCWFYDRRPVKRTLLFTGHFFLGPVL